MSGGDIIERPDPGEHFQFILAKRGHTADDFIDIAKGPSLRQRLSRSRPQSTYATQAQPERAVFNGAIPAGAIDVRRQDAQTMPLGIFNQYGHAIKTHRLVIDQTRR